MSATDRQACMRCGRGIPPRRRDVGFCSERCATEQAAEDRASAASELAHVAEAEAANYRALLLSLIGSLTLADHMGDVAQLADEVLKRIGMPIEWEEFGELGTELGKMGVKTIWGTDLYEPDEDDRL